MIICGGGSILCVDGEYYPKCQDHFIVYLDNHNSDTESDADSTVIGDHDNQEEV